VVPPGTPAPLADAARTGITEAIAAGPTPGLFDAVGTAFTAGLGWAATGGALVFAGLAGLALVAFRQVPVTAAPEVEPEAAQEAPELATAA
jgi:MFS transporter, DHA2 family, multidrug resistance protein